MLACVYVAITNTYTVAHRELLDLVMAVKDSGCISQVEQVSMTKIRGLLALLKHDNLLITQRMEGQPARLCFSPDIQSFYDLRMRHDRFLDRYMEDHYLFVPAILRSELVWHIDEETYYNRMEGLNNLMKHVAEFYAGYLGVPKTASSLSSQIPVRQMLPTNRKLLKSSREGIASASAAMYSFPYAQDHSSTTSSCTTLSDTTNPASIILRQGGFVTTLGSNMSSGISDDVGVVGAEKESFHASPDASSTASSSDQHRSLPAELDWYTAGCRTSSTARAAAKASLQQQAMTSHYLNRVAGNYQNTTSNGAGSPADYYYGQQAPRHPGYGSGASASLYGSRSTAYSAPAVPPPPSYSPYSSYGDQHSPAPLPPPTTYSTDYDYSPYSYNNYDHNQSQEYARGHAEPVVGQGRNGDSYAPQYAPYYPQQSYDHIDPYEHHPNNRTASCPYPSATAPPVASYATTSHNHHHYYHNEPTATPSLHDVHTGYHITPLQDTASPLSYQNQNYEISPSEGYAARHHNTPQDSSPRYDPHITGGITSTALSLSTPLSDAVNNSPSGSTKSLHAATYQHDFQNEDIFAANFQPSDLVLNSPAERPQQQQQQPVFEMQSLVHSLPVLEQEYETNKEAVNLTSLTNSHSHSNDKLDLGSGLGNDWEHAGLEYYPPSVVQ